MRVREDNVEIWGVMRAMILMPFFAGVVATGVVVIVIAMIFAVVYELPTRFFI